MSRQVIETNSGALIFESGPEAFKTTHKCAICFTNKHTLCAHEDPCGVHLPECDDQPVRYRCPLGFFAKFNPVVEE
jgi:hypothetical protein